MKLIRYSNSRRTHVVADRRQCFVFDSVDFGRAAGDLALRFSITPADIGELANQWTTKRPDLLIGAFHPNQATLTTMGDGVALDPGTSKIVRDAARLTGISQVRRLLIVGTEWDEWVTPRRLMRGSVPDVLFHGTSDLLLTGILTRGLRTDQPPNWAKGGKAQVFLTATPQTAAFHARRTADRRGGLPVVLSCRRPPHLQPDWDVQHQVVGNPLVPTASAWNRTREAGLFASPRPLRRCAILAAHVPMAGAPFQSWEEVYRAAPFNRLTSWAFRW